MPTPVYVTLENVDFNGLTTESIVLETVGSDKFLLIYSEMDVFCRKQFDDIYVANGNMIPNLTVLDTSPISLLQNGTTFYQTYKGLIKKVGAKPTMPVGPIDKTLVYYDGTTWKHLYNDSPA